MKKRNGLFRNQKGFTLVELMIVVIIIGILTAVGVPLYLGYVRDAKAASAEATIGTIVNAEKVYYQKKGRFTNVASTLFESDPAADPNPLGLDVRDATQYWTLAVTDGDNTTTFKVTATGKAGTDYSTITVSLVYDIAQPEVWTKTDGTTTFE